MKVEKETIQQQAKFIISQKEKEIAEKNKLINTQQSKLNKLFESIPILKDYDFIMCLCDVIRLPFDIVK